MNINKHITLQNEFERMLGVPGLDKMFGEFTPEMRSNQNKDKPDLSATSRELFSPLSVCNAGFMSLLEVLWAHYGDDLQIVIDEIIKQLIEAGGRVTDQQDYKVTCKDQTSVLWIYRMFTDTHSPLRAMCPVYSAQNRKDFRNKFNKGRQISKIRESMLQSDIDQMIKMREKEMFMEFGNYKQMVADEFAGVPADLFDVKPIRDENTAQIRCPPKLLPYFALGTSVFKFSKVEEIRKVNANMASSAKVDDDIRMDAVISSSRDDKSRYQMDQGDLLKSQISITGHKDFMTYRFINAFPLNFPNLFISVFYIQIHPSMLEEKYFTYSWLRSEITKQIKDIVQDTDQEYVGIKNAYIQGKHWRAVFLFTIDNNVYLAPVVLMVEPRYGVQAWAQTDEHASENDHGLSKFSVADLLHIPFFLYGPLMFSRLRRINTTVATKKGQGYSRCRFGKTVDMGFKEDAVENGKERAFEKKKNDLLNMLVAEELSLVSHLRLPVSGAKSNVWRASKKMYGKLRDVGDGVRNGLSLRYDTTDFGFAAVDAMEITSEQRVQQVERVIEDIENAIQQQQQFSTSDVVMDELRRRVKFDKGKIFEKASSTPTKAKSIIKKEVSKNVRSVNAKTARESILRKNTTGNKLNDTAVSLTTSDQKYNNNQSEEGQDDNSAQASSTYALDNDVWKQYLQFGVADTYGNTEKLFVMVEIMNGIINGFMTQRKVSVLDIFVYSFTTMYVAGMMQQFDHAVFKIIKNYKNQQTINVQTQIIEISNIQLNDQTNNVQILWNLFIRELPTLDTRFLYQTQQFRDHAFKTLTQFNYEFVQPSLVFLYMNPIQTTSIATQFFFKIVTQIYLSQKALDNEQDIQEYYGFMTLIYTLINTKPLIGEIILSEVGNLCLLIKEKVNYFSLFMTTTCFFIITMAGGEIVAEVNDIMYLLLENEEKFIHLSQTVSRVMKGSDTKRRIFYEYINETPKENNENKSEIEFINFLKFTKMFSNFFEDAARTLDTTEPFLYL